MVGLAFLNVLDVSRALGPDPLSATPESVARWLFSNYLNRRGGGFNYDPAINATFDLFRGASTLHSAVKYCSETGNPKGRRQNASAVLSIGAYAIENISRCYRIGFTAVAVGRVRQQTVYIGIKAPMVRVRERQAFVVMPGFRMSYMPGEREIDLACSIALANFARDDFSRADFEYLYAGPGEGGTREFKAIRGLDRNVFGVDSVDALLDVYVKGVSLAASAGARLDAANLHGYRVIDPREPLFL